MALTGHGPQGHIKQVKCDGVAVVSIYTDGVDTYRFASAAVAGLRQAYAAFQQSPNKQSIADRADGVEESQSHESQSHCRGRGDESQESLTAKQKQGC